MKYFRCFVLVVLLGVFLGGCKKNEVGAPPPVTDNDVILNQVSSIDSVADFVNTDQQIINDESDLPDGIFVKVTTPIKPFRWGRRVENVDRNVNVTFIGDSLAVALITKVVSGHFIIAASYSDTATAPDTIIRKPYSERADRKVLFARIARSQFPERNWVPIAITMVEGGVRPDSLNKFTISFLELISSLGKDTVMDPLNTWMRFNRLRHGIPIMHEGDSVLVRLTINSADPDTEHAIMRSARHMMGMGMTTRRERMHLESSTDNGNNTWTRVYTKTFHGELGPNMVIGRFNAVVDVISHGSFHDDTAPFSNRFWGMPYMVLFR